MAGGQPFRVDQLQIRTVFPVIFPDNGKDFVDKIRIALPVNHILDILSRNLQHIRQKLRGIGISCHHQLDVRIRQPHFPCEFHTLFGILAGRPFSSRLIVHFKQPDPVRLLMPVLHTKAPHSHILRRIQIFHHLPGLEGLRGHHIKTKLRFKAHQLGQLQEFVQPHIVFLQAAPVKAGLRLPSVPVADGAFPVVEADKTASGKTHHAGGRLLQLFHHVSAPAAQIIGRHQRGKGKHQRAREGKGQPDLCSSPAGFLPLPGKQAGNRGQGKAGFLRSYFHSQKLRLFAVDGIPEAVQPGLAHISPDACKNPELIPFPLLQMEPLLQKPAFAPIRILKEQRCHSLIGMGSAGMFLLRRTDHLPVIFLIAAVPEGRIAVIMLLIQPQPLPGGDFNGRHIPEGAVVKHFAPHPVHLPAEPGFNKIPENPPARRFLCPFLFHNNFRHIPFPPDSGNISGSHSFYSATGTCKWQSALH